MTGITCTRCGNPMFRSHHREVETIEDAQLVTEIILNECVICTAMVKVILPAWCSEERAE